MKLLHYITVHSYITVQSQLQVHLNLHTKINSIKQYIYIYDIGNSITITLLTTTFFLNVYSNKDTIPFRHQFLPQFF